ncbi:MAG: hypothetical protein GF393_05240 [Armatimonadia bacterium]|nr:hypothetical protein [Armatimonadia bacterium]
MSFADRLREAMTAAGIDYRELADMLSSSRHFPYRLDPRTTHRWVRGEAVPDSVKQEWLLSMIEKYRKRKYAP